MLLRRHSPGNEAATRHLLERQTEFFARLLLGVRLGNLPEELEASDVDGSLVSVWGFTDLERALWFEIDLGDFIRD